jgi:tetratricopeptide (TPR) repeat protein
MLVMIVVVPLYVADRYLSQGEAAEDPRTALELVERAQGFNPVDPDLPQREAELALETGDWSRVRGSYSRAIELDPENYAPYYLLARFYEKRGEYDEALPLYRKASLLNPRDEEIDKRLDRLEAAVAGKGAATAHRIGGGE